MILILVFLSVYKGYNCPEYRPKERETFLVTAFCTGHRIDLTPTLNEALDKNNHVISIYFLGADCDPLRINNIIIMNLLLKYLLKSIVAALFQTPS